MEKHILAKPVSHDGETYTEINFDFDNLKRRDLDKAEKITRAKHGKTLITVVELNKTYQMYLASMAADVPPAVLEEIGAKDYTQIALLVQDFLLGGESETAEAEAMEQLEEYLRESGRTKNLRRNTTTKPPTNPPA